MNTGLDPEILVMSPLKGLIPASYFLAAPILTPQGVLNQLSYDNAAIEMRPKQSDRTSTLTNRLASLYHKAAVSMRMARRKGLIPSDSEIQFIPSGCLSHPDRKLDSVKGFGCSPSLILGDTFLSKQTKPFVSAINTGVRSAGFHIHQELTHSGTIGVVVGVLDGLLGLLDVLVNHRSGWSSASAMRRAHLG